jgi:4-amino-4-deoxy-L-arabinose transferase-like glycosyltransferase
MNNKFWTILILAAIIAINFAFGFPRLDKYSAVDEPYWTYGRTSKFWSGIKNMKWSRTNINDKPGITTAIISGVGLLKVNPLPYESLRQKVKTDGELSGIRSINFYLRLPIYLFSLIFFGLFYFFVRKLFGEEVALFSAAAIGLSPIILGISLIINPDSLLWGFLPLSLLSYLAYLKEDKRKFLIASGIFLGLSLLTKYVSNILYVFFFGLIFLDYIFSEKKEIGIYLKNKFIDYGLLVLISLATFFVLFPATWTKPIMVLESTFLSVVFHSTWPGFLVILGIIFFDLFILKGKMISIIVNFSARNKNLLLRLSALAMLAIIVFTAINTYSGMKFFDFEAYLASPKSGEDTPFIFKNFLGNSLSGVYALIFGLTPITLVFFLWALVLWAKKREMDRNDVYVFYLAFFIFAYFIAAAANKVGVTVRYQIVNYPLAAIVSSFAFVQMIKKYFPKTVSATRIILIILFISISTVFLWTAKPFYLAYSSEILPEKYIINSKDMGDGSYEAAQYLNKLPNARDLIIWTDKGAVCEAFVGRCYIGFDFDEWKENRFDYFVASSGRKVRSIKMSGPFERFADFEKLYSPEVYDYKIEINNRPNNFVKIINAQKIYRSE